MHILALLLNVHWLLLFWLWVTCLISGLYVPYRESSTGYRWSAQSFLLALIGVLAFIAWLLMLLGVSLS